MIPSRADGELADWAPLGRPVRTGTWAEQAEPTLYLPWAVPLTVCGRIHLIASQALTAGSTTSLTSRP